MILKMENNGGAKKERLNAMCNGNRHRNHWELLDDSSTLYTIQFNQFNPNNLYCGFDTVD
jgi:hypothetical protein